MKNKIDPLKYIEQHVYKVKFVDTLPAPRKASFNVKAFIERARKVRKTFTNEDLLRFESNLRTE